MPIRGISGRVVDDSGAPLDGLTVAAFGEPLFSVEPLLGTVNTSGSGSFRIDYPRETTPSRPPPIRLEVQGKTGRVLHSSTVADDLSVPILVVPDITIRRNLVRGLLVTGGNATPQFVTTGNSVEYLVDNAVAWERLTDAVESASVSVNLLLLYFDLGAFSSDPEDEPPRLLTVFDPPVPETGSQTTGTRLEYSLLAANRPPREVSVRLLVNDFVGFPYPVDTAVHVQEFFADAAPNTVEIRRFQMPIVTPMHAKVVVVDDQRAFIVGSPLLQEYYDDSVHSIDDARRDELSSLFSSFYPSWWFKSAIRVPVHELSVEVTGRAVSDMNEAFRLHWNEVAPPSTAPLPSAPAPPPAAENLTLQVVRTLSGRGRFASVPQGETGIFEAYMRGIENAREFIYLENQYVTNPEVVNALALALKGTNLELIMLINNKVDLPRYNAFQRSLLQGLLTRIGPDGRSRVRIFTLWTHESAPEAGEPSRIIRNYVHTKAAIIDDRWATVGSANLDNVSLVRSDYLRELTPSLAQLRASELNVVLVEPGDPPPTNASVQKLRRRLWSEHLGYRDANGAPDPDHPDLANRPAGGWRTVWESKAGAKVDGLKANPPTVSVVRILPFPHREGVIPTGITNPVDYLTALDVDTERLDVLDEVRSFSFKDGEWR